MASPLSPTKQRVVYVTAFCLVVKLMHVTGANIKQVYKPVILFWFQGRLEVQGYNRHITQAATVYEVVRMP
jgi:hypothetical protein